MRLAILFLACTVMAQKIETTPQPIDLTPVYVLADAAQQKQLNADAKAYVACMARKDPEKRNACFHPTHHKLWSDCQAIKAVNKLPETAVCSETDGTIKGKDAN